MMVSKTGTDRWFQKEKMVKRVWSSLGKNHECKEKLDNNNVKEDYCAFSGNPLGGTGHRTVGRLHLGALKDGIYHYK